MFRGVLVIRFDRFKLTFFPVMLFFIAIVCVGCRDIELTSKRPVHDINIDGKDDDWRNTKTFFENERVAIGVFNDEHFLYLSLTPWDIGMETSIIRGGFTVWFDSRGKKKKTFGIRYPIGSKEYGLTGIERKTRDELEERLKKFAESQNELEIIGPGEDEVRKMAISEAKELYIEAGVGSSNGKLFYELKVPIDRDEKHPYSLVISPDGTLGLGFETGSWDVKMRDERADGKMTSTRTTGPAERNMRTQYRNVFPERYELWADIHLAVEPANVDNK